MMWILIVLNVYIYFQMSFKDTIDATIQMWGFSLPELIRGPWVSVTAIFLHVDFWHLFINMWFLFLFGAQVEEKFGHFNFLILFICGGLFGNVLHSVVNYEQMHIPVIGASGAISAIMGAYLACFPLNNIQCLFLFLIKMRIPALVLFGSWIIFELSQAFFFPKANIAHWAHIGGFVVGLVWGLYYKSRKGFRKVKV